MQAYSRCSGAGTTTRTHNGPRCSRVPTCHGPNPQARLGHGPSARCGLSPGRARKTFSGPCTMPGSAGPLRPHIKPWRRAMSTRAAALGGRHMNRQDTGSNAMVNAAVREACTNPAPAHRGRQRPGHCPGQYLRETRDAVPVDILPGERRDVTTGTGTCRADTRPRHPHFSHEGDGPRLRPLWLADRPDVAPLLDDRTRGRQGCGAQARRLAAAAWQAAAGRSRLQRPCYLPQRPGAGHGGGLRVPGGGHAGLDRGRQRGRLRTRKRPAGVAHAQRK